MQIFPIFPIFDLNYLPAGIALYDSIKLQRKYLREDLIMKKRKQLVWAANVLVMAVFAFAAGTHASEQSAAMEYELVSLEEGSQGGLEGVLHCKNPADRTLQTYLEGIAVNDAIYFGKGSGLQVGDVRFITLDSGEECDLPFSIDSSIGIRTSPDSTTPDNMVLNDPLGFFGVTQIQSVTVFTDTLGGDEDPDPVRIELTDPLPYKSFAGLSEAEAVARVFENESICVELEKIGTRRGQIILSMIFENRTDRKQTCYVSGMTVNQTAPFKKDGIDSSGWMLEPKMKAHCFLFYVQEDDSILNAYRKGEEGTPQQETLETLQFSIIVEAEDTKELKVGDITLTPSQPMALFPEEDETGGIAEITPAMAALLCESESDSAAPLFASAIKMRENAIEERVTIPLRFATAWTEEDYADIESAVAAIQLVATDPEWQEDSKDGMFVRTIAQVALHPDGEGGFAGIYSGFLLAAGDDHRIILPLEEDGLGETVVAATPVSSVSLSADRRFNAFGSKTTGSLSGKVDFAVTIDYTDNSAEISELSVTGDDNAKRDLTGWPLSRFEYLSSSSGYRKWVCTSDVFYEPGTSFRARSEAMSGYEMNNASIPLEFIPYTDAVGQYDVVTVSYVFTFTDGSVLRLNYDGYGSEEE